MLKKLLLIIFSAILATGVTAVAYLWDRKENEKRFENQALTLSRQTVEQATSLMLEKSHEGANNSRFEALTWAVEQLSKSKQPQFLKLFAIRWPSKNASVESYEWDQSNGVFDYVKKIEASGGLGLKVQILGFGLDSKRQQDARFLIFLALLWGATSAFLLALTAKRTPDDSQSVPLQNWIKDFGSLIDILEERIYEMDKSLDALSELHHQFDQIGTIKKSFQKIEESAALLIHTANLEENPLIHQYIQIVKNISSRGNEWCDLLLDQSPDSDEAARSARMTLLSVQEAIKNYKNLKAS